MLIWRGNNHAHCHLNFSNVGPEFIIPHSTEQFLDLQSILSLILKYPFEAIRRNANDHPNFYISVQGDHSGIPDCPWIGGEF